MAEVVLLQNMIPVVEPAALRHSRSKVRAASLAGEQEAAEEEVEEEECNEDTV
jgi:hypothetical protein